MIRALHRHFALRAAHRAQRDYDLYQSQPAGAGWNINIATALMLQAERQSAKAGHFISKLP